MRRRTQLEGAVELATEAAQGGIAAIEGMQRGIARKPFAALRLAPVTAELAEPIRAVHDGVTDVVYGCLRGGVAAIGVVAGMIAAVAARQDCEPAAGSAAALGLAALNGIAGDRLARRDHPLAASMELRRAGARVAVEREALARTFPDATPRLALFVHGLAGNESCWSFYSRRHYGDEATNYGSRLQADLGYTPVYVRYNTGLHISENGAQLATLIEELASAWPVDCEEIVLLGHSMGGLVLRSACHQARENELAWVERVRHTFLLGSPHLGAPLEKAGNVASWLLARFDSTRAVAAAINRRSAGIKDLRFGALLDEHWRNQDPDALLVDRTGDVPLLDNASHHFVAATVTRDPHHPVGTVVGDWLVRQPSALGRTRWQTIAPADSRHFGAMGHMELLNHPEVYEQIKRWLRGSPEPGA